MLDTGAYALHFFITGYDTTPNKTVLGSTLPTITQSGPARCTISKPYSPPIGGSGGPDPCTVEFDVTWDKDKVNNDVTPGTTSTCDLAISLSGFDSCSLHLTFSA